MTGSIDNLKALAARANRDDWADGMSAYWTYNTVIRRFANHYHADFFRTLAAFVALSPNNDYMGNLRSLSSVLAAFHYGTPIDKTVISTYNHCRDRAYTYLTGDVVFMQTAKGLKIRSFYENIREPQDHVPVTIDGHMVCAWLGVDRPMKEALVKPREYEEIARGFRLLAAEYNILPNQLQATLWMTRKRVNQIKYSGQLDLFSHAIDVFPADAPPYKRK